MSYVKVIEKLEKQGKRKKELKQQKAEAKAKQQEEVTVKQTEQIMNQSEEATVRLSQEVDPNKEVKSGEQAADKVDQSDQEIVNIIESSNVCTGHTESVATDNTAIQTTLSDTLKVRSPDFSFVDLSIKPRQTLNLIQRNLSSPSYSMQLTDLNNNFLEVSNVFSDKQEQQQLQKEQQPLVNPKKRWLKCSEASSVGQSSLNQESLDMAVPQPPKKRRHIFVDVDDAAGLIENTCNYVLNRIES